MHRFRIECVKNGQYLNYIEHATDPIEAINQLWIRKPAAKICVIVDLDRISETHLKTSWSLKYLREHKEEIKIQYDLMD